MELRSRSWRFGVSWMGLRLDADEDESLIACSPIASPCQVVTSSPMLFLGRRVVRLKA